MAKIFKRKKQTKMLNKINFVLLFILSITTISADIEYIIPSNKLGTISQKQTLRAHVFIKNHGSQFVRIEKIDTSCGCVLVSKKNEWILPNKTIRLEITITPPFEKIGSNSWYINVFTDTKENKVIVFGANVESDIKKMKKHKKKPSYKKVNTKVTKAKEVFHYFTGENRRSKSLTKFLCHKENRENLD